MHRTNSLCRIVMLLCLSSTFACGVSDPDSEAPDHDLAEATQALQTSAAVGFRDTSNLRGSQFDWDHYKGKAGCAANEAVTGLSVDVTDHQGRDALCTADPRFTGQTSETLLLAGGDQRQAQRNGDWAFGSWKLECGSGEYVSAVSENTQQFDGNNHFHGVQCALRSNPDDGELCNPRTFADGDSRGSTAFGDWDHGAYKGECGTNEYVVGVSVSPDTYGPTTILCCSSTHR